MFNKTAKQKGKKQAEKNFPDSKLIEIRAKLMLQIWNLPFCVEFNLISHSIN